jgi:fluoroacetyl-CoA thioesterase
MKSTLQPGVSFTRRVVIDSARTIDFMGEDGRVYGTPYMIMDIEETCRQLILQHADAGEDSVGIDVSVNHLAATLPHMTVEIAVRVTGVEGRKVAFEVHAQDELDTISTGSHERFVVDISRTAERLKAKAAKWHTLKSAGSSPAVAS